MSTDPSSVEQSEQPKYWFPAKRFGWGWGFPNTWQGWLVLVGYVFFIVLAHVFLPTKTKPTEFVACVAFLTVILVIICWLKGERPRWRWG